MCVAPFPRAVPAVLRLLSHAGLPWARGSTRSAGQGIGRQEEVAQCVCPESKLRTGCSPRFSYLKASEERLKEVHLRNREVIVWKPKEQPVQPMERGGGESLGMEVPFVCEGLRVPWGR